MNMWLVSHLYLGNHNSNHILVLLVVPMLPALTPRASSVWVVARLVIAGVALWALQHSNLKTKSQHHSDLVTIVLTLKGNNTAGE